MVMIDKTSHRHHGYESKQAGNEQNEQPNDIYLGKRQFDIHAVKTRHSRNNGKPYRYDGQNRYIIIKPIAQHIIIR